MAKAGSEYQEKAAEFFRSLGLTAKVEEKVQGARVEHSIDVWVTGTLGAFDVRWVVECKAWKTNVPKEKVLALLSIVQDVGADRGWLLSEQGFQSGAILSAKNTNIVLTSLEDLQEQTRDFVQTSELKRLVFQCDDWMNALLKESSTKPIQVGENSISWYAPEGYCEIVGRFAIFQEALKRGIRGEFPVLCEMSNDGGTERRLVAHSSKELIEIVSSGITKCGPVIEEIKKQLRAGPVIESQ